MPNFKSLKDKLQEGLISLVDDGKMPTREDELLTERPLESPLIDPIDILGGAAVTKLAQKTGPVILRGAESLAANPELRSLLSNEIGAVGKSVLPEQSMKEVMAALRAANKIKVRDLPRGSIPEQASNIFKNVAPSPQEQQLLQQKLALQGEDTAKRLVERDKQAFKSIRKKLEE